MNDLTFEIKILDQDYSNLGNWKFQKKDIIKYLRIINKKYNLGFKIQETKKIEDHDLDWAR